MPKPKPSKKSPDSSQIDRKAEASKPSGGAAVPGVPLLPGDKVEPMGRLSLKETNELRAKVGAQMAQNNPQLRYRVGYLECQTNAEREALLREYIGKFPDPRTRLRFLQEQIEEHCLQYYVPDNAEETPPWYESALDVLTRRKIVLQNPSFSANQLCKVFDAHRVPLPSDWEEELGVTTWVEAYKNKTARARIQTLIAKDKKAK